MCVPAARTPVRAMSDTMQNSKKQPILKKRDIILAVIFLIIAGAAALLLYISGAARGSADQIQITVEGELYGTYSLLENREIEIETDGGINVVVIENGAAHMEEADCPDGYCMDQGSIDQNGETIVCLPHKVVVTAISSDGSDDGVDAVAQ